MAVEFKRYRFNADEYHRMAEAGIFDEDSRVELLDGEIVVTPPIGSGHADSVDRWTDRFVLRFRDVARVRVQNPIRIAPQVEPEPDLALVRLPVGSYAEGHPSSDDVLLVVEIADSSLADDRRPKLPIYARAGIAEVWLVDLRGEVVYVHREPSPDGYRVVQTFRRGDKLAPLAFPSREMDVSDLLG